MFSKTTGALMRALAPERPKRPPVWEEWGELPPWLMWNWARMHWVVIADPDPEPQADPRQLEFDFEFPHTLDAGVPCG